MTEQQLIPHPADKSPLAEKAAVKTAKHLSESGHWYDRSGNQITEVPSADGKKTVKCTLVHARKLDLARGVTSFIRLAAAPGLVLWLRRQSVLSALTLPRLATETESEWLARVEEDADKKASDAAEEGTRIHAAIQAHLLGQPVDPAYRLHVDGAMQSLPKDGGEWRTEVGLASPRGYGTKIDLVNDRYLLDFKGKEGSQAELEALPLYDEHYMQVAAGIQVAVEGFDIEKPIARNPDRVGGIVFVSRTHPGAAALKIIPEDKLMRGWDLFSALLTFGHRKDNHVPFQKEF